MTNFTGQNLIRASLHDLLAWSTTTGREGLVTALLAGLFLLLLFIEITVTAPTRFHTFPSKDLLAPPPSLKIFNPHKMAGVV